MNFKNFLLFEKAGYISESAELVYQKILDNLDHGHVDVSDDAIEVNVGKLIKDSRLSNLILHIENTEGHEYVSLRRKGGAYYIFVKVKDELPSRMEIDSFLSKHSEIFKGFSGAFEEYIESYHENFENDKITTHEKREMYNSKENFEKHYAELMKSIKEKMDSFTKAHKELSNLADASVTSARKAAAELAMKKLKSEEFGSSPREFIKIVLSLPSAEFASHLNKDMLKKLNSRLEDYYEQKIED